MAEGWARSLLGDRVDAYSAGIETHGLNRLAVKAMAQAGIDISAHTSKHLDDLGDITFDYVITVCDNAREACPIFQGKAKIIHHSFEDPPRLAANAKTDEEALVHYARVRDEIKAFVQGLAEL